MMSGVPLETCWAFDEQWINEFYYKFASCWLFLLSHTTIHGSMNIKFYAFFWVIPRRLNFICRRFGTLCLFHLHRQVGGEWLGWGNVGVFIREKVWLENSLSQLEVGWQGSVGSGCRAGALHADPALPYCWTSSRYFTYMSNDTDWGICSGGQQWFALAKSNVICLRPVTDVFRLDTHRTEMQSCLVRIT